MGINIRGAVKIIEYSSSRMTAQYIAHQYYREPGLSPVNNVCKIKHIRKFCSKKGQSKMIMVFNFICKESHYIKVLLL